MNIYAARDLSIVRIDLVLHPAQIFDGFTLTRIESFNDSFALGFAQLARLLFGAAFYQTAIERGSGHDSEIDSFSSQSEQQRSYILEKGGAHQEARHTPKIDWLFECFFEITRIKLGPVHEVRIGISNKAFTQRSGYCPSQPRERGASNMPLPRRSFSLRR